MFYLERGALPLLFPLALLGLLERRLPRLELRLHLRHLALWKSSHNGMCTFVMTRLCVRQATSFKWGQPELRLPRRHPGLRPEGGTAVRDTSGEGQEGETGYRMAGRRWVIPEGGKAVRETVGKGRRWVITEGRRTPT